MEQQVIREKAVQGEQKPNLTGIPTQMKLDFESRSGLSFDDVRVHYNSGKPAKIGALAYTQGTQVHIGPGQERHLRHELGHVVQQKSFHIPPTKYIRGSAINDDTAFEADAEKSSLTFRNNGTNVAPGNSDPSAAQVLQRYVMPKEAVAVLQELAKRTPAEDDVQTLNELILNYGIIDAAITHDPEFRFFTVENRDGSSVSNLSWTKLLSYIAAKGRDANKTEADQVMQVKFGFELTFRNEKDFNYGYSDLCRPSQTTERARDILPDFAEKICKEINRLPKSYFPIIGAEIVGSSTRKWKDAGFVPLTVRITYHGMTPQSSAPDGKKIETLDFCTVDLDPSCIEVQTKPFKYGTLQNNPFCQALFSCIFSGAKAAHIEPASDPQTGGGGHISIDAASAFLDTGHYLRNFFSLFLKEALESGSIFQESGDRDNAPFPHEIGIERDLVRIIKGYDSLPQGEQTIEAFVNAVNQVYTGHGTDTLLEQLELMRKSIESTPGQGMTDSAYKEQMRHYQAVNLEHLVGEGRDSQRIEMRRFDAQPDFGTLLSQIQALGSLVFFSRQKPTIPLPY